MNTDPTRILVVEDEKIFAELLEDIVTDEGNGRFQVTVARNMESALARLCEQQFDLMLLDLTLPDVQGLQTYRTIHYVAPNLPVIVLSGLDDESVALEALRAGAQDYLLKCEFEGRLLGRAIRYAIQRKSVIAQLRESEEFFRLISENVSDMISVVDADGRRLYSSPSHRAVLGARDNLVGSSSFTEIHPEDRSGIESIFRDVVTSGAGRRSEYRFVRSDGSVRHVESQSNVIRDDEGKVRKVVMVSRDVTERLEAEQQLMTALAEVRRAREQQLVTHRKLVQTEKLEAVGEFATGLAREVQSPLQVVQSGIDYLRQHVVKHSNGLELLDQMGEALRYADGIVRGLLEFPTGQAGALSSLKELLEPSLEAWAAEFQAKGIKVQTDYAAELPRLRLDPRAFKHTMISFIGKELNRAQGGDIFSFRTYLRAPSAGPSGRSTIVAEFEVRSERKHHEMEESGFDTGLSEDFALGMSRRIIELFGGKFELRTHHGNRGIVFTVPI